MILRLLFRGRVLIILAALALFLLGVIANILQILSPGQPGTPRWVLPVLTAGVGLILLIAAVGWIKQQRKYMWLLKDTVFKDRDFRLIRALKSVLEAELHRSDLGLKRSLLEVVRLRIEYAVLLRDDGSEFARALERWAIGQEGPRHADVRPVIPATDWFALTADENRGPIENYFSRLEEHFPNDDHEEFYRSLAEVRVPDVYVAPLSLLRGLLTEFKQDWKPAIDSFETTLRQPNDWLRRRDVQMFIFDCWLLWGPSVQVCSCGPWRPPDPSKPYVFGQVGFGDENNSMSLYLRREQLRDIAAIGTPDGMPVSKVDLTARLLWSRYFTRHGHVPRAQQAVIDAGSAAQAETRPAAGDTRRVEQPRLILEHVNHLASHGGGQADPAYYYSAYLWILFVILPNGELPPDHAERPWKCVLTFFEHGNIADKDTFGFLQHQLAVKTARGLAALAIEQANLSFAYVCAFDHSGCDGAAVSAFPSPSVHELVHDYLRTHAAPDVRERISIPCACLGADGQRKPCAPWLTVSDSVSDALKSYTACQLHVITEKFLKEVRRQDEVARGSVTR